MTSNEKKFPAPLPSKVTGASAAAKPAEPVAAGNAPVQPAGVASKVGSPPALFGGHRGGGKKRADGLPAGSDEAKEADRKKNALRMANKRAAEKIAASPSPLPPAPSPATSPAPALGHSGTYLPKPLVFLDAAPAAVAAPAFVAWTSRLLEKPARLLVKIIDRARCWQLTKKVKSLRLDTDKEKEIVASFKWKDDAMTDFCQSLATCAEIELNKRRISGAENSHFINLALSAGELVYAHIQTMELLERMKLDNAQATRPVGSATTGV